MSLTGRDIIKRGMRLLGAVATGEDPTADEMADGLTALNDMTRGLAGVVIGPRLSPRPMASAMQAENGGLYQVALTSPATLTGPLRPKSGARFGIIDVNGNLATYNLTVARNGQRLEGGSANLTLNANNTQRIWFFDADSGNWVREADMASIDASPPYPDRLIDLMPAMLAVFMGAEYGGDIRQDVVTSAIIGMQAFARTYGRRGVNQIDTPILGSAQS